MIVLGMTGPIGHGKSTFASAIKRIEPKTKHLESSLVIADVANAMHSKLKIIPDPYSVTSLNEWLKALPEILVDVVKITVSFDELELNQLRIERHPVEYQKLIIHVENLKRDPNLIKNKVTHENKETYRPFLQWLGGYLVQHVKPTIWADELARRVEAARTENYEVCIVGGLRFPTDATTLRKTGALIIKVYRPSHLQNDMLDPTERERDNIPVDCTIMSNGTVEDLNTGAGVVLRDIRANKLQKLYQTAHLS